MPPANALPVESTAIEVMAASVNMGAHLLKSRKHLDAVRKRPAMYVGRLDSSGLHTCAWAIIENSVEEAAAGHGNRIIVSL